MDAAGRARGRRRSILTHPRGDFSVHYACPLLAAAGFAVLGFSTRYLNNDTDCLHELRARRRRGRGGVGARSRRRGGRAARQQRRRLAHGARRRPSTAAATRWVGVAAHPGEGVFMLQAIDPSVADERDPFSVVPELDMYDPRQRLAAVAGAVLATTAAGSRAYRAAQDARVRAHRRASRRTQLDDADRAPRRARATCERGIRRTGGTARKRAVHMEYMTIYRTLADPAYLDLTIDPDDRPLGSLFAFPDPFDANYGRGGLARTMTSRGWLSTWSGLSSAAKLADTMPNVHVPDARRAPDRRHRDPRPAGARDRRRGRQRRRHLRGDRRARRTTSKGIGRRRWRSSRTGSAPASRSPRLTCGSPGTKNRYGSASPLPAPSPTRRRSPGSSGGATPSSTMRTGPRTRSTPS